MATKLVVTGFEEELGMSICEAAGVDPTMVRRVVLDLQVGNAGIVYVEMFADPELLEIRIPSNRIKVSDG